MQTHILQNRIVVKPVNVQCKMQRESSLEVMQRMESLEEEELLQGQFEAAQRMPELEEEEILQGKFQPIQRQANNTGLPENLKSGVENLSGYSMDDVKVHYKSDQPAQLNAHAYAQGTDIHLAPGQEKHLPHEAWHVVQQKQGRVRPTMQLKDKVNINDDVGLEREADVMGGRALQLKQMQFVSPWTPEVYPVVVSPKPIVQRVTYAMRYTDEKEASFAEVVSDATLISTTQAGGLPLVKSLAELKEVKADDKKIIHIVAHGNLAQVGDFDDAGLVDHLKEGGINQGDYYKIVLHSCDSGVEDTREGENQGTTLAGRVRTEMGGPLWNSSTVTGMIGHAMTDSKGETRVLKNPEQEDRYKDLVGRAKKSQDKEAIERVEDQFLKSVEDSQIVADGY